MAARHQLGLAKEAYNPGALIAWLVRLVPQKKLDRRYLPLTFSEGIQRSVIFVCGQNLLDTLFSDQQARVFSRISTLDMRDPLYDRRRTCGKDETDLVELDFLP